MRTGIFILVVSVLASGCLVTRNIEVEYDYSYQGNFRKYETFNFISFLDKDTLSNNDVIESAITARLGAQGYKFRTRKPNLLIGYRVYFDSLNWTGYDQPDIEEWIKHEDESEEYNPRLYSLKKGTVYIQFFDRKQGSSVWQGYAVREFSEEDQVYNELQLKLAVRTIMDKYRFLASSMQDGRIILRENSNN